MDINITEVCIGMGEIDFSTFCLTPIEGDKLPERLSSESLWNSYFNKVLWL